MVPRVAGSNPVSHPTLVINRTRQGQGTSGGSTPKFGSEAYLVCFRGLSALSGDSGAVVVEVLQSAGSVLYELHLSMEARGCIKAWAPS